ncbi:hypothetical protein BAR24_10885 [Gluconobacter oxydans]|nr:hypothetical protein B932_3058 [Gluconobacter oxydans H24]ANQ41913.1 hypothetical protein BAR24_10885 [Gluconobacter oxydans]
MNAETIMNDVDRIMIYANDVSQPETFRVDVDHGLCNVDPDLFDVGQRCQIVADGANIFRTDKRVFELK